MPNKPEVRIPQNTVLACATSVKGDLLALASDARHTRTILAFQHSFNGRKSSERWRHGAKDTDRNMVIQD